MDGQKVTGLNEVYRRKVALNKTDFSGPGIPTKTVEPCGGDLKRVLANRGADPLGIELSTIAVLIDPAVERSG